MAIQNESDQPATLPPRRPWKRQVRGLVILLMGCLGVAAPFLGGPGLLYLVGLCLIVAGVLEMVETFQAPDDVSRLSSYLGGMISILAGFVLQTHPRLILGGLAVFLAGAFLLDGVGKLRAAWAGGHRRVVWWGKLFGGLFNLGLATVLVTGWPLSGLNVLGVAVGLRMLAAGWEILLRRDAAPSPEQAQAAAQMHPDTRLKLGPQEEFATQVAALNAEADVAWWSNAYWCVTFAIIFFAIHVGRMSVDWNLVGFLGPFVAMVGDLATALLIAYGLLLPYRLGWRKLTRPLERRAWRRLLARQEQGKKPRLWNRLSRLWVKQRLRFSWRMAQARSSLRVSLGWALQAGLPVTAVLIALNPIWGFTWYFNSENWAAEVWNKWAEARTDIWREHMAKAVAGVYQDVPQERRFQVEPPGIAGSSDFSFLVIGDPGEGDASQHCLRDQYLFLGQRPDVKFLLISSDVIYPAGAMKDYEQNFYLPFKGFTKPIYAIPGNHDWYDALEGFAANFFEEKAARAAMRARIEVDARLTTTTEGRIDRFIAEAARLRQEFGVKNGLQRGPFFEIQADRFALLAIDTGIARTLDPVEEAWLVSALGRAKGKFIMAILGHPLYAGGRYQGTDDEPFAALHKLLRDHGVQVVMAGDTHYFEYYREQVGDQRAMHHFVNGGGGAYISIGTPLDWPKVPAVPDCAIFPRKDTVIAKLDDTMSAWKTPLWLWTKGLGAWPFSAETMAGAFDFNRAPYFQSFVEVRVENSQNRVRLIPHGANGPLRWRELQTYGATVPVGKTGDDLVEFVVPMLP